MFVRDAEIPPPSSERLRCRQAAQELASEEGRHMWRALDEDKLVRHYQPLVSLADGRLHGFEALLRWNAPCVPMFISTVENDVQ